MASEPLKPGDLIECKAGGPPMVVESIVDYGGTTEVHVVYWDEPARQFTRDKFPAECFKSQRMF